MYPFRNTITYMEFQHLVYGSLQNTYNLGIFRTDKDWWQIFAYASSGDTTHESLFNIIFIPQYAPLTSTITYNSTTKLRVDHLAGIITGGTAFQILFTEFGGVDRN